MLDQLFTWGVGIPETVALAAVAVVGYLFGRSQKQPSAPPPPEEFLRAIDIAHQLEAIANALRHDLAAHHSEVERFKLRVAQNGSNDDESTWQQLGDEAEQVLAPTLRLVGQVASAYDQIRQQTKALSHFTGGRTDAVTGLGNLRSLKELLEMELSGNEATHGDFSIAVLSIEGGQEPALDPSQSEGQVRLQRAATLLRAHLRERDIAARYGVEELAIVMPHTRLFGASVFGRRLRKALSEQGGLIVHGGLAQSMPGDTPQSLLARADSALYSARMESRDTPNFDPSGTQFLHTGDAILPDEPAGRRIIDLSTPAPNATLEPAQAD